MIIFLLNLTNQQTLGSKHSHSVPKQWTNQWQKYSHPKTLTQLPQESCKIPYANAISDNKQITSTPPGKQKSGSSLLFRGSLLLGGYLNKTCINKCNQHLIWDFIKLQYEKSLICRHEILSAPTHTNGIIYTRNRNCCEQWPLVQELVKGSLYDGQNLCLPSQHLAAKLSS